MKQIPNTDISVFPVTLGTMTYGSPVPFADAVALTRSALDKGINLIDTANMYEGYSRYAGSAGGVAEEVLIVRRGNKFGFITFAGIPVTDIRYDEAYSFRNGNALVTNGNDSESVSAPNSER